MTSCWAARAYPSASLSNQLSLTLVLYTGRENIKLQITSKLRQIGFYTHHLITSSMTLTAGSYSDIGEMVTKQRQGRLTTETVVTIPPQTASTTSTCRCLFAPVDRVDNAAALAAIRAAVERRSAARWGYDFTAGRPLPGGRFHWTVVDRRRSTHAGDDVTESRQVNDASSMTSSELVTPPSKRRRHSVTSPTQQRRRRRREIARFADVISHVVVCAPASHEHRNARCRRDIITGTCNNRSLVWVHSSR